MNVTKSNEITDTNVLKETQMKMDQGPGMVVIPLTPALGRLRHEDLFKFEASLVYIESSRLARLHSEAVSKTPKRKKETKTSTRLIQIKNSSI